MNVDMLFLTASQKSGEVDILTLRVGCQVAVLRPCVSVYLSTSITVPLEQQSEQWEVWSSSSSVFVQTEEESHPGSVWFSLLTLKEVLKPQKVCGGGSLYKSSIPTEMNTNSDLAVALRLLLGAGSFQVG